MLRQLKLPLFAHSAAQGRVLIPESSTHSEVLRLSRNPIRRQQEQQQSLRVPVF
jgi:hypothetical protein